MSGIDILDGTPVVDIKPYIPQYDCPQQEFLTAHVQRTGTCRMHVPELGEDSAVNNLQPSSQDSVSDFPQKSQDDYDDMGKDGKDSTGCCSACVDDAENCPRADKQLAERSSESFVTMDKNRSDIGDMESSSDDTGNMNAEFRNSKDAVLGESCNVRELKCSESTRDSQPGLKTEPGTQVTAASWVHDAPVSKLGVRFSTKSIDQLQALFSDVAQKDGYRFQSKFVSSVNEAKEAITKILREDPRSVYRRKQCLDSLYYFTYDTLHITCWFEEECAVVVLIKPITDVEELESKLKL